MVLSKPNLLLCLDTTQSALQFGLYHVSDGVQVIEEVYETSDSQRYHSSIFLPELEKALQRNNLKPFDIDALAVNVGPGSFTGIRTGLSMVRLWGQVRQHVHLEPLPIYTFNTFEVLAGDVCWQGESLKIVLNAFRQRYYLASLSVSSSGQVEWNSQADIFANETMSDVLTGTETVLVEDSLCGLVEADWSQPFIQKLSDAKVYTPAVMARLIAADGEHSRRMSWDSVLPLYLQAPHITTPAGV